MNGNILKWRQKYLEMFINEKLQHRHPSSELLKNALEEVCNSLDVLKILAFLKISAPDAK